MIKRLAAVLLVGAFYFTTALAWPAPGYAQVVSSRQAVCDPQYPTRCIKPAADGSIAITGGGGGGAVTIADGADVAQGAKADLAATSSVGTYNLIQLNKGILAAAQDTTPVNVNVASATTGGCTPTGAVTTAQ